MRHLLLALANGAFLYFYFCAVPLVATLLHAAALTQFATLSPLLTGIFVATALAGGVLLIVAIWQMIVAIWQDIKQSRGQSLQ